MIREAEASTSHASYSGGSHLGKYLDYYKLLVNPGYAVLITGDWGSGKTHQINKILTPADIYYVSLFGTQSVEEIYSAVYAKMFPLKAFARSAAKSTNGTELTIPFANVNIGGLVSGIANAFLREQVVTDRVLVFDDLERSSVNLNDLLGVFNKYVEHHECRVVVIAHDEKISEDLQSRKEKVFGQTIAVVPQIWDAFDSFTDAIQNSETKILIKEMKEEILEIFLQSDTRSLRILKHTLEDLGRLFKSLSEHHRSNNAAVREISFLFLALSLEVRSGRLKEKDLIERSQSIIRFQMQRARDNKNTDIPNIFAANNRYGAVDLGNQIIKDQPLINMLVKGNYIEAEIQESLDESLYFVKVEDLPAWLVFMKFDEIDDAQSTVAATKLKEQFDAREIKDPGEILHLFALRFLLSDMEIISEDFAQTEIDCKEYIDELLAKDELIPDIDSSKAWGDEFSHGYKGYMFWIQDNYRAHFGRVDDHLVIARAHATKKLFPLIAQELLKLVGTDGAKFAQLVSPTFAGNNIYARIDILSSIDPSDFVQEWMGSAACNWQPISRALERRYEGGELDGVLKNEKKWLSEVIGILDSQHRRAAGVRKKRIERILPQSLREAAK